METMEEVRERVYANCGGKTRVEQSHLKSCDINNIVAKYTRTGLLPQRMNAVGLYGDFTGVEDYMSSLLRIQRANEDFENLPSLARKRFRNDPAELFRFLEDENNREEAIRLGLLPKPAVVVPPGAPAEPTGNPS